MTKKPVNFRLNPGTIEWIKEIQHEMMLRGFSMSQADVVEEAIGQLHKKMELRKDRKAVYKENPDGGKSLSYVEADSDIEGR